ncbi:hypothetical protein FHS96_005347 [Sphingomonas zeicaulis]|uniref:DUF4136 domain-containing protein n=1 Tax=Sphingomonas zeicaulis TaxID=1632740 RepID=UPI003D220139
MLSRPPRFAALLLLLGAAGCATPIAPVEVTRFHLGAPVVRGSVTVEPQPGTDSGSLEYRAYIAGVERELSRIGYRIGQDRSDFVAVVGYTRGIRPAGAGRRSPISIGVGGGTGGGGVGLGLGVGFGIGGGKSGDVVTTQLSVQIKQRGSGEVVWEGRAQTEARENAPAAQPGLAADRLSAALFKDFPGESGRTISVK